MCTAFAYLFGNSVLQIILCDLKPLNSKPEMFSCVEVNKLNSGYMHSRKDQEISKRKHALFVNLLRQLRQHDHKAKRYNYFHNGVDIRREDSRTATAD